MTASREQQLYEIFRTACEMDEEERAPYLDEACCEDPALRAEVERLLAQDTADPDFLGTPALATPLPQLIAQGDTPPPEQIGAYRIIRKLDEGGMGVVYLAEQDNPRRTVALKVLRPGSAGPEALRRFEHEAQLLARLQHPGIAQIHQAGTADAGSGPQPYFAMEYVQGLSLLRYADERRLDARERLELLARVCQAVHHAHQRGVVHRDLKPGNIIVTDAGEPKVLDFGVARATDGDVRTTTMRTTAGELLGTIAYMSPEQASGDPEEIDTRCDVYALGAVGYELLSGSLPHEVRDRSITEAVRLIQERDPAPLSSHAPSLRGDVETIITRAMEKDRERRYQSALELAHDIRRFLRDEPIAARPPSTLYQLRKFTRRNRTLVASSLIIAATLVIGLIATAALALALAHQRDEAIDLQRVAEQARQSEARMRVKAEREATVANAVSGFLEDVFASGSPHVGRHDMTVAEALDIAAGRVDEKLRDQPAIASAVRLRLADTYYSLGNLDASLAQMEQSLADLQAMEDADPMEIANRHSGIGQLLAAKGATARAEPELQHALDLFDAHGDPRDERRLTALINSGALNFQLERYEEAATLMREAWELREQVHGPEHPYTLTALNNLGNALRRAGDLHEAEPLIRKNMELHRKVVGDKHPNTITGIYNYADLLRELGRHEESERLFLESIELGTQHLPTGHWLVGLYRDGLGELLRELGRFDEAEPHLRAGYHTLREQLSEEHSHTERALRRLVSLYEDWGQPELAAEWQARLP